MVPDTLPAVLGRHGLTWDNPVSRALPRRPPRSIGGGADEAMLGIICKYMGIIPGQKRGPHDGYAIRLPLRVRFARCCRQPRRDCAPHHAHRAPHGVAYHRGLFRVDSRRAPRPRGRRWPLCIGGPLRPSPTSTSRRCWRRRSASGADAVHPGYGFLAESPQFAQAVLDAGLVLDRPAAGRDPRDGDKGGGKAAGACADVPACRGTRAGAVRRSSGGSRADRLSRDDQGGGRRRRPRHAPGALESELASVRAVAHSEAEHAFGDGRLLLERALEGARHVEVQVFADPHGNVVHLGERDCSVQRRHQKLIEESPSPAWSTPRFAAYGRGGCRGGARGRLRRRGHGRVPARRDGTFHFMEMKTGQVEHPVTEAMARVDLVEWQLSVAGGDALLLRQEEIRLAGPRDRSTAVRRGSGARIPSPSRQAAVWHTASTVRTDHALENGATMSPWYDSMMAKMIAHGASRGEARESWRKRSMTRWRLAFRRINRSSRKSAARRRVCAGRSDDAVSRDASIFRAASGPLRRTLLDSYSLAHAGGFGEWTRWNNNPAHGMRARFGETDVALASGDRSVRILAVEGHSGTRRDGRAAK